MSRTYEAPHVEAKHVETTGGDGDVPRVETTGGDGDVPRVEANHAGTQLKGPQHTGPHQYIEEPDTKLEYSELFYKIQSLLGGFCLNPHIDTYYRNTRSSYQQIQDLLRDNRNELPTNEIERLCDYYKFVIHDISFCYPQANNPTLTLLRSAKRREFSDLYHIIYKYLTESKFAYVKIKKLLERPRYSVNDLLLSQVEIVLLCDHYRVTFNDFQSDEDCPMIKILRGM